MASTPSGPFTPTPVTIQPLYQDRPAPYQTPIHLDLVRAVICLGPPTWIDDPVMLDLCAHLYGEKAARIAQRYALVPQNVNGEYVGGTFYQNPLQARRSVWDDQGNAITIIPPFPSPMSYAAFVGMSPEARNQYLLALAISLM
jgi:hypothetical protein